MSLNGEPLTYLGKQEYGGDDYGVRWDGLFGNWLFNAQIARHTEENSIGPASSAGDIIEIPSNPNGVYFSPTARVDVGGLVATSAT